jgi:hypothetical protein
MKEEKHFCDRCRKEISITYDLSDKWKNKNLELCSNCYSEFERLIKTKDKNKFEMEGEYHKWKEASYVLGFFLVMFLTIVVILVTSGVCR